VVRSSTQPQSIIVEDGNSHRELARSFTESLGFAYLKKTEWNLPDKSVDMALRSGLADTKYIIYSHNDVEFYPGWLDELDAAIKLVPERYFGMMNFPYNQYLLKQDNDECEDRNCTFRTCLLGSPSTNISIANDIWNPERTGRMSIVSCFQRKDWEDIGDFSLGTGFDWELHYKFCREKRWNLYFRSSQPMKHLNMEFGFGSDTQHNKQKYLQIRDSSHQNFKDKYGIAVDIFLDIWFGEIQFQMRDEIASLIEANNWQELENYCPDL
jgi:hypothetical protein